MNFKPRTCPICRTEYMPASQRQIWCPDCRHAGTAARKKKYNAERGADPEFRARRNAHMSEYSTRPEVRAHKKEYRGARKGSPEYKAYYREYRTRPASMARQFLCVRPECSASRTEIAADIASDLDWEGNPRLPGVRYHKEHNHETGEYYGHVPAWLNRVFTEDVIANWPTVLRYAERRGLMPSADGTT